MDTITHGIAGALIGKAMFRGDEMFAFRAMNRGRVITWSLMLGAIFPDSDVFREMFSRNELLILTWHRSITHSLICYADLRSGTRRDNAMVCALAEMGCAIVRGVDRNLCGRHWKPHSAGSGDVVRHDDLVAVALVAARVGFDLHRRLHIHGAILLVRADSSLGLRDAGRIAESRPEQLADFRPGDHGRGGYRTSGWRADFGGSDSGGDRHTGRRLPASVAARLRSQGEASVVEPGGCCSGDQLCHRGVLRAPCSVRSRAKVRGHRTARRRRPLGRCRYRHRCGTGMDWFARPAESTRRASISETPSSRPDLPWIPQILFRSSTVSIRTLRRIPTLQPRSNSRKCRPFCGFRVFQ